MCVRTPVNSGVPRLRGVHLGQSAMLFKAEPDASSAVVMETLGTRGEQDTADWAGTLESWLCGQVQGTTVHDCRRARLIRIFCRFSLLLWLPC